MTKVFYEAYAVGVDGSQPIDDFASFCENMAHQNLTVLIAARLGDHKLNGFKEILNVWSKTEKIDRIVEGRLCLLSGEKCQLQQTKEQRSTIENYSHSEQKGFVFYVEGASSV